MCSGLHVAPVRGGLEGAALGAVFQLTAEHVETHDGGGHLDERDHGRDEAY
jgi:hypothetical protein